ncbi:hypothetical protein APS47_13955 [Leptospira kirschneri serovar Mozdok]|uniref:hypothetical protein n=3 Tax=Leptospira kirschneri TaxID=29507 RepID=UPI000349A3B2|nr:hypothetical protein [Leptospira kirschneri]KPZ76819.1 hypothetical protein APS47_13955 [Leptospira kirschneri serovar Mozdok]
MIFLLKRSLTILKTCSLRLIPYFPFSKPKIKSGENLVFTSLKQIQFIKNLIFYSKKRILFSEYSLSLKFKIFLLKLKFFILAQNIYKNVFSKYILKFIFKFVTFRNSKDSFRYKNRLTFQKNDLRFFDFNFFSKLQNKEIKKSIWFLKRFFIFLTVTFLFWITDLFAVESRIGVTFETYESRYSHYTKENWFFKTSNCTINNEPIRINLNDKHQTDSFGVRRGTALRNSKNFFPLSNCFTGFVESRNGSPFVSGQIDQKFFRASFGHRFRPLENFYFLRDNNFYTALPGIDQPIHKAGFLGFKWKNWSIGTYYSEQEAKHKPGIYFISPWKFFEFAYSPEMKKHYASVNFHSDRFGFTGPKIVSRIQTFGQKKEIDGTFYSSVSSEKLEFKLTGYRGKSEDLFALDPDRNELKGKAQLARLGIVSNSYFSLEWIRAWNRPLEFDLKRSNFFPSDILQLLESEKEFRKDLDPSSKRWEIIAGKAPIFYDLFWGGILLSLRNYSNETIGRGIYYGLVRKNFTIEAGQEWRMNGDCITEGKWSFRLNEFWNLEGAFLFQKEDNKTDSLFEARTARDETSFIFTDRSSSFRLRLLSPYIAFTVSHSRRKENKNDGIWINLQIQFPF